MCTYVVTYRVIGECNIVVEASNVSDAIQIADRKMLEKDFNDLDCVEDYNPKYIEDQNGKKVEEY